LLSNCEKFLSGTDYQTLARLSVFTKKPEYLTWIFYSFNAYSTWRNMSPENKRSTIEIISQKDLSQEENEQIAINYNLSVKNDLEETEDVIVRLFDLVKDNEHEHFQQLLNERGITGLG
jgi:hypothetical protein